MPILITLLAFILLCIIYLFLTAPNARKATLPNGRLIAHRGLFEPDKGIPENSLSAFDAACSAGYAIELDVQITRDDVCVVFHDDDLRRMCGVSGGIMQMRFDELRRLRLSGTEEPIPTLADVLARVNGRAPLLVELKSNPRRRELVLQTTKLLDAYRGAFVVESFDPLVLLELKRQRPNIARGQLVSTAPFPLSRLALNFLSRPDFVAYNRLMSDSLTIRVQRSCYRTPLAAWTLKGYPELEAEKEKAQMLIFDGFKP